MREPQRLAVVRLAPRPRSRATHSRFPVLSSLAGFFMPASPTSSSRSTVGMHQRTFARVAPMRARLFFYACLRNRALSCVASLRRAGAEGRGLRARGARAALGYRRSLCAPRQHPRSQRQRARPLAAVGERLRRAARDRRSRRRPRRSSKESSESSIPRPIAALHDRHLWFVWIARKVPHDVAARVRSLGLARRRFKGRGHGPAGRYQRPARLNGARLRRHR